MLIPKAALYFYCKNQLEKGNNLSNDASPSASNKIYADIIYETWLGQFWNNFNAVGKICLVIILFMIIAMGFGWK